MGSKPKFKQMRSGRGTYAVFVEANTGEEHKVRLAFWALTFEGELVGLVMDSEGPTDATSFSNFVRFERSVPVS